MKNQAFSGPLPMRDNERGSVIVWIFVMVALFAALIFALNNGSRTGASTFNAAQADLRASEIISYGQSLSSTIQEMRIGGCLSTQISFDGSGETLSSNYTNAGAPVDEHCHVFKLGGGGRKWASADILNNLPNSMAISGANQVKGIGTDCSGSPYTSCVDLVLFLIDINEMVCAQINRKLGIDQGTPVIPEVTDITAGTGFTGTYADNMSIIGDTSSSSALAGQKAGCFKETMVQTYDAERSTSQTPYLFYQVLVPR